MKIRPVGAEIFHAGGRTDMTKQVVAFRNFANAPNKTSPSIAQSVQRLGYGLDNRGTLLRFLAGLRDFLISSVQTGSGTHPASY